MKLLAFLFFLGLVTSTQGATCTSCESTYTTARDAAGADAGKCTALKDYMTCMETGAGAGCPLTTVQAGAIVTDLAAITCALDPLCTCQKDYWAVDISGGNPADCTAAKSRVACLRGKTGTGCDGSAAINALGTSTDTVLTAIAGTCTLAAACTCERNYVKADVSDDTKMCTETLKFLGCVKSIDGTLCGTATVATAAAAADTVQTALSSPACSPSAGCACEVTYAKADVSDDTKKCTQAGTFLSCLKTKTGAGCDGSTTVASMATTADTAMQAVTGCTQTAGCVCEATYAKADIADDAKKCTQAGTFISCLKTNTGAGCDGSTTVATMATTADTAMQAVTGCTQTAGCVCEATYAKADIADDTKKCTQAGTFITCLKSKDGNGCDGSSTVVALATAADTAMTSSITGCTQTAGCVCEATYAKADIADDAKKCTQAGTFISCLKTNTGAGCDGSTTVASMATTADTAMQAVTGCTQTAGCVCEATYAKADISDNTKKCTQAGTFLSCLKTKTGTGCDGSTTVSALATAVDTVMKAVTGCTQTAGCLCEVAYAQADLADDTKKCTAVKAYISCLKANTGMGCDGATTVVQLATAAESTASGITGCTLASTTCGCELAYAKADISDDTKLCTETKTYVDCLKDKAATGCADAKSALVTAAKTTMSGITGGACTIASTVCECDADYAALDVSTDALKCTASKNYISCLLGKTGTGCTGTTLIVSATTTETAITTIGASCTKTSVCDCEITYAKADISSNANKCTATKALTTCIMLSIDNGCGETTTKTNVGTVATASFTALSTNCATTPTCDCQATFNAADVTVSAKCTSANALITCLDGISSATETACDGTQITTDLKTNATTSVQTALCSFGSRVEASSFLAVFLMTMSVLVISL